MRSAIVSLVSAVIVCAAVPVMAQDAYVELVPWSTLTNGVATSHFAHTVSGDTSFHNLSLNNGAGITRVDNLGGVQTMTELVSPGEWTTASGKTSMSAFYGFNLAGEYLQFAEPSTDAVWRVHKDSGAITEYVSKAAIDAFIGGTGPSLLSPFDSDPISGELVFYEGDTDSLIVTTGMDSLDWLVTDVQLTAAMGNDRVSGGIGFDAAGNLYWGSSTSDDLWMLPAGGDPDMDIVQVLSTAEILAVTGATSFGPREIFPAPDGWVYIGDTASDGILRFDPSDPANTLEFFLTSQELLDGPAGSDNIITYGWYDDGVCGLLTFQRFNQYGLFVVEPLPPTLDIKPGSCPNSFNRDGNGVLPVALVGRGDCDLGQVDFSTLTIARADGIGGSVGPNEGPPGPHTVVEDVATPFTGESCDCHELGGDGIPDLSMKFRTQEVVDALMLYEFDPGALVELVVAGELMNGMPFEATDCVRLVPPGMPPGQLVVTSNVPGVWIDSSPLDLQLDGGGFTHFERTYPETTVVTLTAPESVNGEPFNRWIVEGVAQPAGVQTIDVMISGRVISLELEARFGAPNIPPRQRRGPVRLMEP